MSPTSKERPSARGNDIIASVLSCPDCQCGIDDTLHCTMCGRSFAPQADGIIDALPRWMTSAPKSIAEIQAAIEGTPRLDVSAEIVRYEQSFHDQQASYYDNVHTYPLPSSVYYERLIRQQVYGHVQHCSFVLDLCCGTGKSSIPLLKRGMTVIGMDVSRQMLRAYRRKLTGENLILLQADASLPPLRPSSCQAIVMIGGLHHIPNRESCVSRCSEALIESGVLVLHEPLKVGASHWLKNVLTNAYALTNPFRIARALGRRLGLNLPEKSAAHSHRPEFTPYEKAFGSASELSQMLPSFMKAIELRSQCTVAGREFPPHLQHSIARPLARAIVSFDFWLTNTGRSKWFGDAIFGAFRRAS